MEIRVAGGLFSGNLSKEIQAEGKGLKQPFHALYMLLQYAQRLVMFTIKFQL